MTMSQPQTPATIVEDRARRLLDPKSFQQPKTPIRSRDSAMRKKANGSLSVNETGYDSSNESTSFNTPAALMRGRHTAASFPRPAEELHSRTSPYSPQQQLNPRRAAKDRAARSEGTVQLAEGVPSTTSHKLGSPYFTFGGYNSPMSSASDLDIAPELEKKRSLPSVGSGFRSMIEGLHGVESRPDQPQKKVKRSRDADEDLKKPKSSLAHKSSGIVREYMKPSEGQAGRSWPDPKQMVDLTGDDDNDDVLITGQRDLSMQEVCYGSLKGTVAAHLVPKPKDTKSLFSVPDNWPMINCTLGRESGKDTKIRVVDPHGVYFGNVTQDLAKALAPILDGFPSVRTQARLWSRRKKPNQWPGQPCSDNIDMNINVYGLRRDTKTIGLYLSQQQIWFKPPVVPDRGFPICIPHEWKIPSGGRIEGGSRTHLSSANRTIEEANQEITRLFDHFASNTTTLPSTEPPSIILTPLLEHQKQALTFLLKHEQPRTFGSTESENSSLWRRKQTAKGETLYIDVVAGISVRNEPDQVFGGLLADVMGLGKTIEALALIATSMDEARKFSLEKVVRDREEDSIFLSHAKGTILVSPLSAVKNWEDQISEHVQSGAIKYCVYHGPTRTQNAFELCKYDVVITTYGTVASDIFGKASKGSASPLRQLKWFRIILDEAHTIREVRAVQSQAIFSLWAQRRWCLTGTPIQNRIDDLGSLTRFLKLFPYDNATGFNQYIRAPASSGDGDFLKSLRVFIDSFTLRRQRDKVDLPKRLDLVETLQFTQQEQELHDFFKERSQIQVEELAELSEKKKISGNIQHHVLRSIMTLRLICAHGKELLKENDLQRLEGRSAEEPIDLDEAPKAAELTQKAAYEFLRDVTEAEFDVCRQCDKQIGGDSPRLEADEDPNGVRCYVLPCFDLLCNDCFAEYKEVFDGRAEDETISCPLCRGHIAPKYIPIPEQWMDVLELMPEGPQSSEELGQAEERYYGGPHTKTKVLLRDIEEMQVDSIPLVAAGQPPLKCVVFSEFTSHLDLIQRALLDKNYSYLRIDGTMSLTKRRKVLDALNQDNNATILLASIKAAGQGLNLTAASRVFIMEPMWNPAAEAQAVDRVYRIGQKREVIIKRYRMAKSIELKIVELQRKKLRLAEISMERNHKILSQGEARAQHMKDILALFK